MSALVFGIVAGLTFGALSVGLMLSMSFPDKTTALLAAFTDRFAIGFLIPLVSLPLPGWARGAVVGLLCGFRRRRPPIPTEGDHLSERGGERRLMVG